jgi:hypothetical protein
MARGWESKSVESQMEERSAPRERASERTREDLERDSKRHGIEMSRQRIERELKAARSDTHRAALENALAHLDSELRKLS